MAAYWMDVLHVIYNLDVLHAVYCMSRHSRKNCAVVTCIEYMLRVYIYLTRIRFYVVGYLGLV